MTVNPLVSVIIPTKNSEATIERCLGSIKKQSYQSIEVVIVDGYSEDNIKIIAQNFKSRIILSNANRSRARNIGANKAGGEFIFFVDSDMDLECNVIEECVQKIRNGYQVIVIPEVSIGHGFWAKCKALEKLCYIGDELIEAERFFKRNVFETIKGFDEELEAGEDWDLSQRVRKAGFKVGRVKSRIQHYEGNLRLFELMKKKYNYGKTIKKYAKKHPFESSIQLRGIRVLFLGKRKKLSSGPLLFMGLLLMKCCEFIAGGIGLLMSSLDFSEYSRI